MSVSRVPSALLLLAIGLAVLLIGLLMVLYVILVGPWAGPASPTLMWLGSGLLGGAALHFTAAFGLWRGRRWADWLALAIASLGLLACVWLGLGEITPRGYVVDASGNPQPMLDLARLAAETSAAAGYALVFVGVVLRRRSASQRVGG